MKDNLYGFGRSTIELEKLCKGLLFHVFASFCQSESEVREKLKSWLLLF